MLSLATKEEQKESLSVLCALQSHRNQRETHTVGRRQGSHKDEKRGVNEESPARSSRERRAKK